MRAWPLAAAALVGALTRAAADCTLYQRGELSYCASLEDEFLSDRNYPAERLDSAAMLTAQMICNQDWAAGAFVVGGEYGAGITSSQVCANRGSACQAAARAFACAEAGGNKGFSYYEAQRDPERLDEFELTSYERAPARIADELWRAELGGDCPGTLLEPVASECCKTLMACNATEGVRMGGYTATPSEFCSATLWAEGSTVVCNADGSARLLTSGSSNAALAISSVALAAALVAWAARPR
ncbi:hypothetical protein FNF29_05082 [Cafeteria roenbergensis]|uniref:Uncharacterized protein n=1 Tax=Cafeteria roenbergensis TaxID=33653 RepID=A0A5A8CCC7_CAFRO|nr:hypothetical protein FNF29_05082 [Cafeteria roenbergensis]|eukprot:KAA0150746.1 hypothetical protein FNF29_05082 [Cafeteria roenbergensis]